MKICFELQKWEKKYFLQRVLIHEVQLSHVVCLRIFFSLLDTVTKEKKTLFFDHFISFLL